MAPFATPATHPCDTAGSTESKLRHPCSSRLPQRSQHSAALANSRLPALKDCASAVEICQKWSLERKPACRVRSRVRVRPRVRVQAARAGFAAGVRWLGLGLGLGIKLREQSLQAFETR